MSAPPGVERDFPLARLTTIGTGGPARCFARPASRRAAGDVLAWAAAEELDVAVVGLGIEPAGGRRRAMTALAVRLEGALAAIEIDGTSVRLRRWRLPGGGRAPHDATPGSRASSSDAPFPARSAVRCA